MQLCDSSKSHIESILKLHTIDLDRTAHDNRVDYNLLLYDKHEWLVLIFSIRRIRVPSVSMLIGSFCSI